MFERVYCLNLDKRTDRWEECLEEFKKIPYKVERFPGIDGKVNLAYLNCLKEASKYKSSLILEDDVEFIGDFQEALKQLPDDWDAVFLGANLNKIHKIKVTDNLYRYEDGWATHAVGYTQKMLNWIIDNFDPDCGTIYDEWFRLNMLPNFKCYIVAPLAAIQRPSFSDLRNRYVDYSRHLKKDVFR